MDENKNFNPNNEDILNQNPYDEPTVGIQNDQPSTPYQSQYPQQPYQQQYQEPTEPQQPYQQQYQEPTAPQQPYQQQYREPTVPQQPYQQQYREPTVPQQPYQQQYQQSQQQYQQQYQANSYNTPPQNQYGQPYQPNNYNAAPVSPEEKTAKNFAVTSLVLGIVSLCCCGLITSIPGLIFGIISLSKKKEKNGMAIAGIILAAVGLIGTIIGWIVIATQPEIFRTNYHITY